MNYNDPQLRTALAAEYVLGTLHGRARQRFERLLATDAALLLEVRRWQNDMYPVLIDALPEHSPPDRVWQAISREARSVVPFAGRLPPAATPPQEVAIWRRSTMRDNWRQLATAAVMLLAIYLVVDISLFTPSPAGAPALEVTINDETALPAWSVRLDRERRLLSVSIIRTQTIAAANSFELWMLPGEGPDQAPVSLGLIPASGEISLRLTAELAAALVAAGGLAVSLEPAGGSPTGQPTGPILYQGVIEPAA